MPAGDARSAYPDRRASSHLAEAYSSSPRSFGARSFVNTLVKSSRRVQTTLPLTNYWRFIHPQDAGTTRSALETMGTEDREAGIVPPDLTTSKVKGKRSKLNQRKSTAKDADRNEHVLRLDENGDGVAPQPFFGADPLGMNLEDSMQQQGSGSPTLLSALKGSSLRAAYGQEFGSSFKEDDMGLLGDFKNAGARFSLAAAPDDLGAEGDLQADALWNSFPVDVDSLLPSGESSGMYDDMPGSSGRFDSGMAAGRPGVNNNAGPNGAEMFRPGSVPSQYMYDGYGNVNNSGQMMISGGGTNFDSSFDAYGGQAGMQQMGQRRGVDANASQVQVQMRGNENGGGIGGYGPQQTGMMAQQMRGEQQVRYFLPSHQQQGQQHLSYVQVLQQQSMSGQQMQGRPMMQQQPQYQQSFQQMPRVSSGGTLQAMRAQGMSKGGEAKGTKRAGKPAGDEKRSKKASKVEVNSGMPPHRQMGPGGFSLQQSTRVTERPERRDQEGIEYHPQQHQMMMQQQHHSGLQMSSMYSGSSSVSTTVSGGDLGSGGNRMGVQMMMQPYYVSQMAVGGEGQGGQMHMGQGIHQGMSIEDASVLELEAIIGKLDKTTMRNIKDSLYRLAGSARARGMGNADGGHGATSAANKSQSLVDRCVANLLYHRYAENGSAQTGGDVYGEGSQQQRMSGSDATGTMMEPGKSNGLSGMNVIRGRHGSA